MPAEEKTTDPTPKPSAWTKIKSFVSDHRVELASFATGAVLTLVTLKAYNDKYEETIDVYDQETWDKVKEVTSEDKTDPEPETKTN